MDDADWERSRRLEVMGMPNWAVGDLKVRGAAKNLKHFLDNIDPENSYWIKGTRRTFASEASLEDAKDQIEWDEPHDEDVLTIVLENVETAWGITRKDNLQQLEALSKKFCVDLRTTVWEQGMEFKEEVEILQGRCTILSTVEYNDWIWESERPTTGG